MNEFVCDESCLQVSNLPGCVSRQECVDLMKTFGAVDVVVRSTKNNKIIFAKFSSDKLAASVMSGLHQKRLLDRRLVVLICENFTQVKQDQFVDDGMARDERQCCDDENDHTSASTRPVDVCAAAPFPAPSLHYCYPAPTRAIVTRIANQMIQHPRLYTQVLHLLNKMCLEPPFGTEDGADTQSPDLTVRPDTRSVHVQTDFSACYSQPSSSPEGSEMEDSEPEDIKSRISLKRPRWKSDKVTTRLPNAHRVLRGTIRSGVSSSSSSTAAAVMVKSSTSCSSSRPVLRIASIDRLPALSAEGQEVPSNGAAAGEVTAGFPLIGPPSATAIHPGTSSGDGGDASGTNSEQERPREFISERELNANRLSTDDMSALPVCARYSPGNPSLRLYVKNIAKTVLPADLRHIYGRFVDWDNEDDVNAFDVRLMQEGRMKGQAFISLASVSSAQKALRQTHGFILKDKPLVVQFARTAPSKQ